MKKIIVDTGVFVALFNRKDRHFEKSLSFIKDSRNKLLFSTESVVTETSYLLDFDIKAQVAFLEWLSASTIQIAPTSKNDFMKIKSLMLQYKDLPMDYADATLVNLYEKLDVDHIATFDSDFEVYRVKNKIRLSNIFKS